MTKEDDEGFGFYVIVIILMLLLLLGIAAYIADLFGIVSLFRLR